jgi:hypothetical protein
MGFLKILVEKLLGGENDEAGEAGSSLPVVERRSSVRLNHRIDLNVQLEAAVIPAVLVNLTFTGLSLNVTRELEVGLELTLIREDLGPSFKGTVQWCQKEEQDYLVGIECELDQEHLIDSWLLPALEEAGFKPEFACEQRKLVRHPSHTLCILSDGKGTTYYDVLMLDLSLGGALVECHHEFAPGASFKFRTEKPGFCCQSIVRSVKQHESLWHCSLEFQEPHEQDLKAFLSSHTDAPDARQINS